jgi:hypothetical protein
MTECARCTGVHWQVAQATSLSNIYFKGGIGSQNQGLWMENGSGGFLSDLIFEGGKFGLWIGNQQFTSRNITIRHTSVSAIYLNWDWVWSFQGMKISDTPVAIDVNSGAGSLLVIDSVFDNCDIGIRTKYNEQSPVNSLVLDHLTFNSNSGKAVVNGDKVVLNRNGLIKSWVQGRVWHDGRGDYQTRDLSNIAPDRPKVLAPFGEIFQKPRPQYKASEILNVKDIGINSGSDITASLNNALKTHRDKVLFFPFGTYYISDTVYLPPGSRIMGQIWSVFMATGNRFSNMLDPVTMFKVGNPGEKGTAQLVDLLFSARGPAPGAKLIEWNMADPDGQPGACGIWDVHFRIGGAIGTNINPSNCPRGDGTGASPTICNGVWGMMHIKPTGTCYMENVWGWTADHDIDFETQLNVYTARGFLCESDGPVWMYGTAFEHNYLYQYNFVNASNVFMGVIQTETPYYQPSLNTPFIRTHPMDPIFCSSDKRCNMSFALQIKDSDNIFLYGSGLYSFFNVWSQDCLQGVPYCQLEMTKIIGSEKIYNHAINTYGSVFMMTQEEKYSQANMQINTFCSSSVVDLNKF